MGCVLTSTAGRGITPMTFKTQVLKEVMEQSMNSPEFVPTKSKGGFITYCNLHCHRVLHDLGYDYFYNTTLKRVLLANEQVKYMDTHPHEFSKLYDPAIAAGLASQGRLVLAGLSDMPNGHVCPIGVSGELVPSKQLCTSVPYAYNVGQKNGYMSINWIYKHLPNFYIVI